MLNRNAARTLHAPARKQASCWRGFSLVEVLVITGLAMVAAAALLPRILHSRVAANEASAISSVDIITMAQESYKSSYPGIGYADSLSRLSMVCRHRECQPTPEHACLVDCRIAQATSVASEGYTFHLSAGSAGAGRPHGEYVAAAISASPPGSGRYDYCAVEDQQIRWRMAAPAHTVPTHSVCRSWAVLP
jgi:hypothetical protein